MSLRYQYVADQGFVAMVANVSSLAFPPPVGACALVPDGWNSPRAGVVPEFDLDIWATTDGITITNAELFGAKLRAITFGPLAVTSFDNVANEATLAAHGMKTGTGPVRLTNVGGVVPAGYALLTDYYVIATGANTFKLALTREDALNGVAVDITTNGTGTTSVNTTGATYRVHWMRHGALETSIALDSQRGHGVRCEHRPGVIAYAIAGTVAGGNISASITMVQS